MAIYRPTPGLKGRTFKLCALTRWDFNFCVRSSPLRGRTNQLTFLVHSHLLLLLLLLFCLGRVKIGVGEGKTDLRNMPVICNLRTVVSTTVVVSLSLYISLRLAFGRVLGVRCDGVCTRRVQWRWVIERPTYGRKGVGKGTRVFMLRQFTFPRGQGVRFPAARFQR